jgi:uncharacterized protein YecA (UPF0149 family)
MGEISKEVINERPPLTEEEQKQVDQIKLGMLEQIREKNPRLYYKITVGDYKPWLRESKLNRNDLCGCGSNKKVKHCCGVSSKYYMNMSKKEEKVK